MKKILATVLAAFCSAAAAEWKCVDASGHEYMASQRVMSDTCTDTSTGEERSPSLIPKPKPYKSNPKEARKATAAGKAAVRAHLKDPDSAQFRGLHTRNDVYLCGEVNARNSYGGYGGFKEFVTIGEAGLVWFDDGSEDFLLKQAMYCVGLSEQEFRDIRGR